MEETPKDVLQTVVSDEEWRALQSKQIRAFSGLRTGSRTWIVLAVIVVLVSVLLFLTPFFSRQEEIPDEELAELAGQSASVEAQPMNTPPTLGERLVTLSVASLPQGATVFVDFDSVGVTPLRLHPLKAGAWILSVRKDDYVPVDTVIVLEDHAMLSFSLDLAASRAKESATDMSLTARPEQRPARVQPARGSDPADLEAERFAEAPAEQEGILITSDPPGAGVWLDDEFLGETPLVLSAAEEGLRHIRFQKQGYAPYAAEMDMESLAGLHRVLMPLGSRVTIQVQPQGAIYIDGMLHKNITGEPYETFLSAEAHRIKALHPVLGTWEQVVHIAKDSALYVLVDLNKMQARVASADASANGNGLAARGDVSTRQRDREAQKERDREAQRDSLIAEAQRNEEQYQYHAGQGDALFSQGDYEAAVASYEKMLLYKPGDPYAVQKIEESNRILQQVQIKKAMLDAVVEDGVYLVSEEPPKLIGGLELLQQEIVYPKRAYEAGIQGRVYISFVVDEIGRVLNPRIVQGLGFGCDEEVLRVIRQARMEPGTVGGRPVKVRSTLYFDFKISE